MKRPTNGEVAVAMENQIWCPQKKIPNQRKNSELYFFKEKLVLKGVGTMSIK